MKNYPKIFILIWISLFLHACTTATRLPQEGKTMKTIYEEHWQAGQPSLRTVDRPIHDGDGDLSGYTREAHTELQSLFPRLPNPELIMYVDPHLTKDGHPIPGYSTTFPMYVNDQYALPGESPLP